MYLGVQAVLVKSFARIHQANLVNFGILPLIFADPADYGRFRQGDRLELPDVRSALAEGRPIRVVNATQGFAIEAQTRLSARDVRILLAGGTLNDVKTQS
jgi:aconitate hydratase